MQDFRKLKVWAKAHELVLATYKESRPFPATERFGLTAQMRRSAISIAGNIAEGCGKSTKKDFVRYLYISMGSSKELDYYLLLARDLEMLTPKAHAALSDEANDVQRMLLALIRKIRGDDKGRNAN